tara:strand:+ start:3303 stop:4553 length:1251 start_codon:yes stop_codon:yes gene_type:complete
VFIFLLSIVFAKSITADPAFHYELLFTNPVCETYRYVEEVYSQAGERLFETPKNVYCSQKDREASGYRSNAPQQRMVDWIQWEETKEIFLSFFSFSDARIMEELCNAVNQRDIKVDLLLDAKTSRRAAEKLQACVMDNKSHLLKVHYRGYVSGIRYAHMKMILINANEKVNRLIFGSGNLSSGTVLHHENWNFMQLSSDSYFMQAHHCAMRAMLYAAESSKMFRNFLKNCKQKIQALPEEDALVFFAPAEGKKAERWIVSKLREASSIAIAAHRFSNREIIATLLEKLNEKTPVSLIVDDDMYWVEKGRGRNTNSKYEVERLHWLLDAGMSLKYMQTNSRARLLHHNKFIILHGSEPAVFHGAGNITISAFQSNLENFYYFRFPQAVNAFDRQYDKMWQEMATEPMNMPRDNIAAK